MYLAERNEKKGKGRAEIDWIVSRKYDIVLHHYLYVPIIKNAVPTSSQAEVESEI